MKKYPIMNKIIEFLERGLLMFVFFLLMFSVGRIVFIAALSDYMGDVDLMEILSALWIGLRLSCQTSGILTLIILMPSMVSKIAAKVTAVIVFVTTSVLYIAAFPFYRQFHSNFNQVIFNAVNDDIYALLVTLVDEFKLPLRLLMALILSMLLYKLWVKCLQVHLKIHSLFVIALTYLIVTLTIFGGGLNWQTELNFENIGITKDAAMSFKIESLQVLA